jgi:hypothetical protein
VSELRTVEVAGVTWFVVAREYESAHDARRAWERLDRRGRAVHGALELGVYRHGPELPDGRADARFVTAVGHVREGAEEADRLLGGEPYLAPDAMVEAMIARRIRVMAELEAGKAESGSYVKHHERGARLRPGGIMEERDEL